MTKPPSKPRPQPKPRDKAQTRLRAVTISTDLEAPIDIKAIAKEARLTPKERDLFAKRVKDAIHHMKESPEVAAAFVADPLRMLSQQFEEIAHLPNDVRDTLRPTTECATNQAASAALSNCARALIIRVAQWSAMSPGNRSVLESDPNAAVDAVGSWGFPAEAVTLVKSAFQTSRHAP